MWAQHNRFFVIFLITGLLIGSISLQNISANITPPFSQLSDAAMSVALDFFGSGQVTTVRGITENQYGVPDENGNISTEILSMSLTGPDQPAGSINPVQSCSPGASFVAMDSAGIVFGARPTISVTTIIVEKEVISCVTDIANNPTHIYDTFILEEMINNAPLRYQTFVCEKDELTAIVLGCIETAPQDIP